MVRLGFLLKVTLLMLMVTVLPAAAAEPCRIVMLGDSITAGFGVAPQEALPRRLEAALRAEGHDCAVIDAGVSGDTSAGGAARLDWVLSDRPTHLIVELGGNDALRALPVDQLEANLDDIVRRARAAGVEVMLAGMLAPPNLGQEYGRAFAAAYRDVAEKHDVPLTAFFLDGVILDPVLMQPDRIHPNARGVEEIVRRLLPMVATWIGDA